MNCPLHNDISPINQYACQFIVYGSHCHWLGRKTPKGLLHHSERHGDQHQTPVSPEEKKKRNSRSASDNRNRLIYEAQNGSEIAIKRLEKLAESNRKSKEKYRAKRRKK